MIIGDSERDSTSRMFHVGRYDPTDQSRRTKRPEQSKQGSSRKRSRKERSDSQEKLELLEENKTTLRVIADETDGALSASLLKKRTLESEEEAIDDLDILESLIEGNVEPSAAEEEQALQAPTALQQEIRIALRMAELPIDEAALAWKLAPFLVSNLKRDGHKHFFPIQALAIPDAIASERHAHIRAQDVCITAPTGSGKTLSYVLPILNSLWGRQVRRLRALVVLPSRDLATQVHRVFENYTEGSELKVGIAIGQSDFRAEQKNLTLDESSRTHAMQSYRLSFQPGNLAMALSTLSHMEDLSTETPLDGWSNVDVLVCTPGRLVDHMENTRGFTLQHLQFLVVDEADRLLSQSFNNWIDRVIDATRAPSDALWKDIVSHANHIPSMTMAPHGCAYRVEPITWRRAGASRDDSDFNDAYFCRATTGCRPLQLRKFLVSATLTRDPQKLAAMRLVNPKHFDVHQLTKADRGGSTMYSMPGGLKEFTVECTAEQKPLVLLALLVERLTAEESKVDGIVVVFTASVESTHRLARLLQLLWASGSYGEPGSVVEFSSALNQNERSDIVQRSNEENGRVSVIVCSDGMSRGMDIDRVGTVINYDIPGLAKTYVHRCGRTARANRKGAAISLLKGGQVVQFHKMRKLIQASDVQPLKVNKQLMHTAIGIYRQCVGALRSVLDDEENGELEKTEGLTKDYLLGPDEVVGDASEASAD